MNNSSFIDTRGSSIFLLNRMKGLQSTVGPTMRQEHSPDEDMYENEMETMGPVVQKDVNGPIDIVVGSSQTVPFKGTIH